MSKKLAVIRYVAVSIAFISISMLIIFQDSQADIIRRIVNSLSLPTLLGETSLNAAAPTGALNIFSGAATNPQLVLKQGTADATGPEERFIKSRATDGSAGTIVNSGDTVGIFRFYASNGTTFDQPAKLAVSVDGVPGASGDMPGAFTFSVAPDGSASTAQVLKLGQDKAATFAGLITSTATSDIGWAVVSVANQACNTTCTNACVFGQETTSKAILACTDATADTCLCAGAS